MALQIEKPAPLMVNGKAYYTLTSYEPVSIEVEVVRATDEDVEYAIETLLAQSGSTRADLRRPAWYTQHTEGVSNEQELREAIRAELEQLNAEYAEQQKAALAVQALTSRLRQAVPTDVVERIAEGLFYSFAQQLSMEGISPDDFAARTGTTLDEVVATFDERARQIAEQEAALDAYARDKKITVSEEEFPVLLGIPEEQFAEVLKGVRAAGSYGEMRDAALHAKAAAQLVSESACTYRLESPEEAQARVRQVRAMGAQLEQIARPDEPEAPSGHAGLRLV